MCCAEQSEQPTVGCDSALPVAGTHSTRPERTRAGDRPRGSGKRARPGHGKG